MYQKEVQFSKRFLLYFSSDFLIAAGPFFATPIEDSRSHGQKPMGFLRCERESSIGVAKNGPAERQNLACEVKIHWVFSISMFFFTILEPFWGPRWHLEISIFYDRFLIDFWPLGEASRGPPEAQVGLLNVLKFQGGYKIET